MPKLILLILIACGYSIPSLSSNKIDPMALQAIGSIYWVSNCDEGVREYRHFTKFNNQQVLTGYNAFFKNEDCSGALESVRILDVKDSHFIVTGLNLVKIIDGNFILNLDLQLKTCDSKDLQTELDLLKFDSINLTLNFGKTENPSVRPETFWPQTFKPASRGVYLRDYDYARSKELIKENCKS